MKEVVAPVGFFQLFRYAKVKERWLLGAGGILAMVSGLALVYNFYLSALIIKDVALLYTSLVSYEENRDVIFDSGSKVVLIGLGMSAMAYVSLVVFMLVGENLVHRMRKSYMDAVLHMDMAWFDGLGAGEITTRISSDMDRVRDGVCEKVVLLLMDSGIVVLGIAMSFLVNWRLSLWVCSLIVVCCVVSIFGTLRAQRYIVNALAKYGMAGSLMEEVIASIRTTHSFNMHSRIGKVFEKHLLKAEGELHHQVLLEACVIGVLTFSVYYGMAIAIKVGRDLMVDGHADVPEIVFICLFLFLGMYSASTIPTNLMAITNARAAAANIYQVIGAVPTIHSKKSRGQKVDAPMGHLWFKEISFQYPSRPDVPIFKDFSLQISPGTTVALVGASGSGKSSLVQLLERFYDPMAGQVMFDNVDIKDLNIKWYRRQIGLVSQEPVLFSGSIIDNVALGLIGTRLEFAEEGERIAAIQAACKDANAHEFIVQLPKGYLTDVGEQGFMLSGGQKQRIAIARAIVKNPRVLLLDEATSALDTASEKQVQSALDRAAVGRTTLVIAHRLSTIRNAQLIVVMDRGCIVEQGTHHELMAKEGTYYQLVNVQNSKPTTAKAATGLQPIPLEESDDAFSEETPLVPADTECGLEKIPTALQSVWKIFTLSRPELGMNLVGLAGAFLLGLMNFIVVGTLLFTFRTAFKVQMEGGDVDLEYWKIYLSIAGVSVLAGVSQMACLLGFGTGARRLSTRLRLLLLDAILSQEVAWFDTSTTGNLVMTTSLIPQRITCFTGTTLGAFINVLVNLVASSSIGFYFNWNATILMLMFLPLLVGLGLLSIHSMESFTKKARQAHKQSTQLACENAAAMRTVASLTKEDHVFHAYKHALKAPLKASRHNAIFSTTFIALSVSIPPLVTTLAFIYIAYLSENPRYRHDVRFFPSAVLIVLMFILVASDATRKMAMLSTIRKAKEATTTFSAITSRIPKIQNFGVNRTHIEGIIHFNNVHFSYPTRPSAKVLQGIDFQVYPGQYIALVGPSGCGKSTTIGLLERYYDVTGGTITLDTVDLRDYNLTTYRDHIALVGQEPSLFNLSIKDNILLGACSSGPTPTMQEVMYAAKSANVHDFITSLPNSYDTLVGGKGTQLSGGQKQRIAIARALIRNPKILLLDEATSALDADSEKVVQATLDAACQGRTTIAIAHRLSTIKHADMILVMKDGIIVERGTHDQLLSLNGLYCEMAYHQALD